jgi:hypothetical protein
MQICHSTLLDDDAEPGILQKSAMMARTHANAAMKVWAMNTASILRHNALISAEAATHHQ